jgi:hypothetical protein
VDSLGARFGSERIDRFPRKCPAVKCKFADPWRSLGYLRQAREIHLLRKVIVELTSLPSGEETVNPPIIAPLPPNVEKLRLDAAEVHRLRAEVAKLSGEKVETDALQARNERLALELSAILRNANRASDSVVSLGQHSLQESARWLTELPLGGERDRVALAVIGRWAASDPVASAAWSSELAEGPLRDVAMSMVARQWALSDWNAAANWLQKLPMGSSRDVAIDAFVTSADGHDIKLASEWANQMEDPESRATRVEQMARRWLREDNAAARTWLENAQLPSGLAERLLSAK